MTEQFAKYKHLHHRTNFGLGPSRMMRSIPASLEEMVDEIFVESEPVASSEVPPDDQPVFDRSTFLNMNEAAKAAAREDDRQKLRDLRSDWLYRMAKDEGSVFRENMTLFWHGHLACQCNTYRSANSYLQTLRRHALGNVRQLVLAVAKEPAMLRFLNNQQNRKGHPNENFARELLELFTMGEGNYSEKDVRESARAFTGWGTDRNGRFMVRPAFHDFGQKEFFGKRGNLNGDDIIELIFEQRATAIFIATKIYAYFVSDVPNSAHISSLADKLHAEDFELMPTMRFMFLQPWFYEVENVGNRIKSPIDLIVQMIRLFDIRFKNNNALSFLQRGLGQLLFSPPNVAGWPGGRSWINNATLMFRLNLPTFLLDRKRFDHATATPLKAMQASMPIQTLPLDYDIEPLLEPFKALPYAEIEKQMKYHLLAVEQSPNLVTKRDLRGPGSLAEILMRRIVSLPEFQMC